jgi:hypothetical protein
MLPLLFAVGHETVDAPTANPVVDLPTPHAYRSGLVVGLSEGLALGSASGYPNNSQDIGDSAYYSAGGWMAGTATSLFVMGALSDYLNFGFWFGSMQLKNSDWNAKGAGVGFRIEAFPLVDWVPSLHGLGVLANLGLGTGTLTSTTPNLPQAGGTQSFGGIGLFHEWAFGKLFGLGHFAAGPALEFDAIWTQPYEQHAVVASGRLVFYGGP